MAPLRAALGRKKRGWLSSSQGFMPWRPTDVSIVRAAKINGRMKTLGVGFGQHPRQKNEIDQKKVVRFSEKAR